MTYIRDCHLLYPVLVTVPKPDYKGKKTINKDQNDAGG